MQSACTQHVTVRARSLFEAPQDYDEMAKAGEELARKMAQADDVSDASGTQRRPRPPRRAGFFALAAGFLAGLATFLAGAFFATLRAAAFFPAAFFAFAAPVGVWITASTWWPVGSSMNAP